MWPWEHVLFAYVFLSVYVHLRYRFPPGELPVVALVFGSALPDIVDKPLAWQFGLFETGWNVAHSIFVAVPVSLLVYAVARRWGHSRVGTAFGFGYLLHFVGDVLPASISRNRLYLDPILWPLGNPTVSQNHESFSGGVQYLFAQYIGQLLSFELTPVLTLQLLSVVLGIGLWLYDGRPGLRLVTIPLRRALAAVVNR